MIRRPQRLLMILACVTQIGIGSGCARRGGDAQDSAGGDAAGAIVDVRVAAVELRAFPSTVTAPGQWRSGGELVIAAPFSGVVEELSPRAGDRVKSGERLGLLVTRESWSALRGAELMQREAHDDHARAEAERALTLARRDLIRVPLIAPQSGVVMRRALEPGALVAEAGEILAIVPASNIVFEAHVPAAEAARLRAGQQAMVSEQGHAPRPAAVQRILPIANSADQSALVWLAPRGADVAELDRYGSAIIVVGAPHRALAVPDSSVVEDDLSGTHKIALVGADGRITWTTLTLGATDGGWHEVKEPALAAGARVVIEGQRGLPDSTRVKWAK